MGKASLPGRCPRADNWRRSHRSTVLHVRLLVAGGPAQFHLDLLDVAAVAAEKGKLRRGLVQGFDDGKSAWSQRSAVRAPPLLRDAEPAG